MESLCIVAVFYNTTSTVALCMNHRTVVVAFRVMASSFSSGTPGPTGISAGSVKSNTLGGLVFSSCTAMSLPLYCHASSNDVFSGRRKAEGDVVHIGHLDGLLAASPLAGRPAASADGALAE